MALHDEVKWIKRRTEEVSKLRQRYFSAQDALDARVRRFAHRISALSLEQQNELLEQAGLKKK